MIIISNEIGFCLVFRDKAESLKIGNQTMNMHKDATVYAILNDKILRKDVDRCMKMFTDAGHAYLDEEKES